MCQLENDGSVVIKAAIKRVWELLEAIKWIDRAAVLGQKIRRLVQAHIQLKIKGSESLVRLAPFYF